MKLPRRQFLLLAAGAGALPAMSRIARAQVYPTRPVRIIVGFAAGGTFDITARLIGEWLSQRLAQPFLIENRPGAGGNLGTEAVVKASPDGHTLLLAGTTSAINATLYDKMGLNFVRDIAPVASILRDPQLMVANPSIPAKTVPEFITYAKANPAKINFGSVGVGSTPHVSGELFNLMAGVHMIHVPYRGGAPALTDLIGGQIQIFFGLPSASIEYVRAGKLRALAVTAETRLASLPDIPSVSEFVPGFEASAWLGIGAPKNTPVDIIEKLNKEINAGLDNPKIKARLTELGSTVQALSPADFAKVIADDVEKWVKVIRAANIKVE
jgi:tripartite-type tricarboxylate transporter receptor subunit TctC